MRLLAGPGYHRPSDAKYLLADERVIFMVRQHPARVLPSLTEAIGGLLVALAVGSISEGARSVHLLVWILAAFLIVRSFLEIANWVVQYIVLTDQRLILTSGLFRRKVLAFPLMKLLDMSFSRSTAGSLLGYGTFSIESDGGKAKAAIDYIPYPDQLYQEVINLLYPGSPILQEKNENADDGPPTLDDLPVVGGNVEQLGVSPETEPRSSGGPEEPPGVAPDGGVGQAEELPGAGPHGDTGQPELWPRRCAEPSARSVRGSGRPAIYQNGAFMTTIAFLGPGRMGTLIAGRVLAAGHDLIYLPASMLSATTARKRYTECTNLV